MHLVRCRTSRHVPTLWFRNFRRRLVSSAASAAIIHDTGAWLPTNHLAAKVAAQHRLPLVVSPRGMLAAWSLQHKALRKRIAWGLYQRRDLSSAALLHATSLPEAKDIQRLQLCRPIAVVPNGVELPPFEQTATPDSLERQLLFLSRIHPKKGLIHLVEAWARLKPEGWHVVIAGTGEAAHERAVRELIQAHQLEQRVRMIGAVDGDAKWELYRSSDLFVLPSYNENFGLVIAEALASGLPVITTTETPWEEIVAHQCGWWISVGTDSLEAALAQALRLGPEERAQMGRRGRQLIESRFSWSAIAQRMTEVYLWLLGKGTKPDCVIG